ncbi:unnamed protein product [Chironomus riparius]|uniref:Uncharacterized protein n=1 Tax=Chironomus riparius TaxID=315576 RepID=A0A9N9X0D3_9DIPT|nr:unnamed protein product [Chironomus riparius]
MKFIILSILVLLIAAYVSAAPNTKTGRDTELDASGEQEFKALYDEVIEQADKAPTSRNWIDTFKALWQGLKNEFSELKRSTKGAFGKATHNICKLMYKNNLSFDTVVKFCGAKENYVDVIFYPE